MDGAISKADGFWCGLGVVLTVCKVWLAVALVLAALAAGLSEHPAAAVGFPVVAGAGIAPFVRMHWFRDLRETLVARDGSGAMAGLLAALIVAIALLWLGMGIFSALSTGTGVTQAMVPTPLARATAALVAFASLIGGVALLRLRLRQGRTSP